MKDQYPDGREKLKKKGVMVSSNNKNGAPPDHQAV
jgi:hypothetical protein